MCVLLSMYYRYGETETAGRHGRVLFVMVMMCGEQPNRLVMASLWTHGIAWHARSGRCTMYVRTGRAGFLFRVERACMYAVVSICRYMCGVCSRGGAASSWCAVSKQEDRHGPVPSTQYPVPSTQYPVPRLYIHSRHIAPRTYPDRAAGGRASVGRAGGVASTMRKRANAPLPGGRCCPRQLRALSVCLSSSTVPGRDRTTPSPAFHTFPYPHPHPHKSPLTPFVSACLFVRPSPLPLFSKPPLPIHAHTHTRTHTHTLTLPRAIPVVGQKDP
ncbi:hypothetical protein COCSADRAFT_263832 [Bipolaris sorokiniana ND90Pr]|uniref:Uncharacterized protein n=1 Tax=Cochliobolus sativus (strain ND90Pr / ATCC 201652) TaxID=665912 RepID=M2SP81_COCSN|nr:uncharacterized protein COCSADRAFT_263832 [Bipolaris sorokiniana ND90Pr]EMD58557.1 hypothetical protein COCSADRAFT_263832 [Bipolaris sorokiniana ND90Pr]